MQHLTRTRKSIPLPDLTPLADVAWLLIVFFLIGFKVIVPNQHPVDLPSSTAFHTCGYPTEFRVIVQANGQIWIGLPLPMREALVPILIAQGANPSQLKSFLALEVSEDIGFGPAALLDPTFQIAEAQKVGVTDLQAIPDWIVLIKTSHVHPFISLHADQNTPYPVIAKVFAAFQQVHVNRFSLITGLEREERQG